MVREIRTYSRNGERNGNTAMVTKDIWKIWKQNLSDQTFSRGHGTSSRFDRLVCNAFCDILLRR